jgi:hypothetical protein
MEADPAFHRDYRRVTFEAVGEQRVRSYIWVRLDGRVGIERAPDRVAAPAYLLAGGGGSVARLDEEGRMGLDLDAGATTELGLDLDGRWCGESAAGTAIEAAVAGGVLRVRARAGAVRVLGLTLRPGCSCASFRTAGWLRSGSCGVSSRR